MTESRLVFGQNAGITYDTVMLALYKKNKWL